MKLNAQDLSSYLQGFKVNRQLTYDLLNHLTEDDLQRQWPRPGLDTFSKHFQEMTAVQLAFISAMNTGVMDFSSVPDVYVFEQNNNKVYLQEMLASADKQLEEALSGEISSFVKWDDLELSVEHHLVNLISHEVFHQGQMTLALYSFKLPIPESWCFNWALPPSESNKSVKDKS